MLLICCCSRRSSGRAGRSLPLNVRPPAEDPDIGRSGSRAEPAVVQRSGRAVLPNGRIDVLTSDRVGVVVP
ncbi:hypothetical protein ACFUMH_05915 [Cellulomonas sp. NPDC057328]|uniref:hypothetical protein n=1 Tax=Cellulomonas sp. NPDC057328 TaxID=3346101 RepID=UPI0036384400